MSYPPQGGPGQPYPQQPYGAPPPGYPVQPPPKKTSPWKAIFIALGVVLAVCIGGSVIAAVAGGGDDPKTTVAQEPGSGEKPAPADDAGNGDAGKGQFDLKLGTKVTVSGDDSAQNVTVKSFKTFKEPCNQFAPEPKNGMYMVIDVAVESTKGSVAVNALNFTWVAEDGTTSDSLDGAFSGCEKNHLDATDLRAGQKRAGQIVLDVASPKGAVEFKPDLFSEAAASWKVG